MDRGAESLGTAILLRAPPPEGNRRGRRMLQAVKAGAIVPVAAGRSNESQGLKGWYRRTRGTSFNSKQSFVAQSKNT
jgi:hypothetical protein